MKYVAFMLLLGCSSPVWSQQVTVNITLLQRNAPPHTDSIYYSLSRKLTWDDFKGRPETGNAAVAITNSGFGFNMGARTKGNSMQLNVTVNCSFNKAHSWVKKGYDNDYVLNHEQHHFDISWYCATVFYNKLKAAKITATNYSKVITDAYTESTALLTQLQDLYDSETQNGILRDKQEIWNKKIDALINRERPLL